METVETIKAGLPIRVLVADDQRLVREGETDIVVIGAAEDGVDTLHLANILRPDVLLLDLVMPRLDGIEVAKQLQETLPDTKIIVRILDAASRSSRPFSNGSRRCGLRAQGWAGRRDPNRHPGGPRRPLLSWPVFSAGSVDDKSQGVADFPGVNTRMALVAWWCDLFRTK
jgi:CheY-like chemotaxis protein